MKVFISWSGNTSHRVALVFREWLPSVIQSIEPYVSSEDIDKGARWSTDIAKELENSTFGVLCVTRENLHAPWLSFEAGALSKTMDKSFVTPFLFDIKRSEVNGPILQFQSTIFEKSDIKKLLQTLNKACGDSGISDARLDRAFDVWYPTLESELQKLHEQGEDEVEDASIDSDDHTSAIIEEILELSRDNQKLLRNPDTRVLESLEEVRHQLERIIYRNERSTEDRRMSRNSSLMFVDELLHGVLPSCQTQYAFLILLNGIQSDFPWLYSMGKGLVDLLQTGASAEQKYCAINECRRLIEFTYDHRLMRDIRARDKEQYVLQREQQMMLRDVFFDMLCRMEEEVQSAEKQLLIGAAE